MKTVSKNYFRKTVINCERAFLVYIDTEKNAWLQADLEIGGESPQCRVELMDFL